MVTICDGKQHYAVTVIGNDQPGIVAGTAEILFRIGCNIEDSSCTMLGGQFAIILILSHQRPFPKSRITDEFKPFCERMGLSVFVRSLKEAESHSVTQEGEMCIISVYGSDRPGIVYRVTAALAERKVNIADLNTKLIGSEESPVYVLVLEAVLPAGLEVESLQEVMESLKKELQVEITVRQLTPVSL